MGMFAFNSILNGMIKFENIWKVLFLYQARCAWYKSYADTLSACFTVRSLFLYQY